MANHLVPLPPGTRAPDFTLRQTSQLTISLHRLNGRPVILVFFPAAFEPVSWEQLTQYQEYLPHFELLNAEVLGISTDHNWCQEAFAREAGIAFPLLADVAPRGRVSQLYGVFRESEETSSRALFVIDSSSVVRFGEAYPDLLNPGVDDLLTVLESLAMESADQGLA